MSAGHGDAESAGHFDKKLWLVWTYMRDEANNIRQRVKTRWRTLLAMTVLPYKHRIKDAERKRRFRVKSHSAFMRRQRATIRYRNTGCRGDT
ncbi:hypothetical protein KCP78_10880 [Salmonella enterica subsp. enterica]|nr:hypothetical protein KCP78_10880 [Salmonella enterica subsp. enterica]